MDKFRKMLSGEKMVMTAWSGQQDPLYLSLFSKTNFDTLTLDMQHGMQTEESVIRGIAAMAPLGLPVIVRIPVGRFDMASKVLDAGAAGIIAPMINTVEDARQLVSFSKYIPTGDRSFGPTQAASVSRLSVPDYVSSANSNTVILAMIETRQAVDNMAAIADVEGVDGLFCGPGDLSISIRQNALPDPYGPDTIEFVKQIAAEAKQRDKVAATWCGNPDHVKLARDIGYDFAALGHDHMYLTDGANKLLAEAGC